MKRILTGLAVAGVIVSVGQAKASEDGHGDHGKEDKKERHAGEQHGHSAPHGGTVITVDSYHYEMVVKGGELRFYLLDGAEKTLPIDDVSGQAVVRVQDRQTLRLDLERHKGYLRAKTKLDDPEKFVALVTLRIDGKSKTGRFTYERPREHDTHGRAEGAHGAGGHSH